MLRPPSVTGVEDVGFRYAMMEVNIEVRDLRFMEPWKRRMGFERPKPSPKFQSDGVWRFPDAPCVKISTGGSVGG